MRKLFFWVCILLTWLSTEVSLVETSLDEESGRCPPGKFRWIWCRHCPRGRYCPGDGHAYQCPPGKYSRGRTSYCTYCPQGTVSHGYGWKRCQRCENFQRCVVANTRLSQWLAKTVTQGAKWTKTVYDPHPNFGLRHQQVFEHFGHKTRMVVGYAHWLNKIIVYFRGTANARNVMHDLNAIHMNIRECHRCSVHKGFYNAHSSLRGKAEPVIRRLKSWYKSATITVMGHSLGGAMAVHQSWRLKQAGFKNELITYGAPRTGNQYFARYINGFLGQHYRVVWRKDPVVALPPHRVFRYLHDGTEINFESPNKYTIQALYYDRIWNRPNPYNTFDHLRYDRIAL